MEDATLKIERERSAWVRQVDDLKARLEAESSRRSLLENAGRQMDADLLAHKQAVSEHEKNASALRKELSLRSQELAKAISLQDKTIVEHVHVLEEAKKYTDRQLAEAQSRISEQNGYIQKLERTNRRLKSEGEDASRELQNVKADSRRSQADAGAAADLAKERRARETAEATIKRLQSDLQAAKSSALTSTTMANVSRSRTVDSPTAPDNTAALRRQYDSRIAELEKQVSDSNAARTHMDRLKKQVEQRYADLTNIVQKDSTKGDSLKSQLLAELQSANSELDNEMYVFPDLRPCHS